MIAITALFVLNLDELLLLLVLITATLSNLPLEKKK